MSSKKIWHAFLLIFIYLLVVSLIVYLSSLFFYQINGGWGWPLGVGIALWIASGALHLAKEQNKFAQPVSLFLNALACGFLISTLAVKAKIYFQLPPLLLLSVFVSFTYLFLAALLTAQGLAEKIWYVALSFVLSITASVFFVVYLYPLCLKALSVGPPFRQDLLFVFYLIIFGFLSIGSILPTYDANDLFGKLAVPALIATFIVGIIVLLLVSGGEGCDCECGDCGDCGRSSDSYNGTRYRKKKGVSTLPKNE